MKRFGARISPAARISLAGRGHRPDRRFGGRPDGLMEDPSAVAVTTSQTMEVRAGLFPTGTEAPTGVKRLLSRLPQRSSQGERALSLASAGVLFVAIFGLGFRRPMHRDSQSS